MNHPVAIQPLLDLSSQLRVHGCPVSSEQTMRFIEAVKILGPKHIEHIRLAALTCLAIDPDQRNIFEAIFRSIFYGQTVAARADSPDDEVDAYEPTDGTQVVEANETTMDIGTEASATERLGMRDFNVPTDMSVLKEFQRQAPSRLPHRNSYRWKRFYKGSKIDFRRIARLAVKNDGELLELKFLNRKVRQRKILLLIDVSGSMKELTRSSLLFAHSVVQAADAAEVFTLGTRLTRVSSALKIKQPEQALDRVSALVADFDGGTRIGDALQAYLAVPRFAGFAKGAAVIVLSDGLERGDHAALEDAVRRLSAEAWRISWLTPLAADPQYSVQTEALQRILPFVNDVSNGNSVEHMCAHVLNMAKVA